MLPKEINDAIAQLPGEIEIYFQIDFMGGLSVSPLYPAHEQLVGITNQYDGSGTCYVQDSTEVNATLDQFGLTEDDLPVVMMVDSWTYRHLVGGQSD